jgi:hypothetical protein
MHVKIYFEIPNREECDTVFKYLRDHPRDIWDYEEHVKQKWIEERFNPNFHAHWSNTDILSTDVTRTDDSNIIQHKVTLRAGANDPRILVDLLRRCKCVQEGVVGGNWRIQAWYQRENEDEWTTDTGNDGQVAYQTALQDTIQDLEVTHSSIKIQTLLYLLKKMTSK